MRKSKYTFTPILLPTKRSDAPIVQLKNGVLVPNSFVSPKWKKYDMLILSNRPINEGVKFALSFSMNIVDVDKYTNKNFMAIEASTLSNLEVLKIDEWFVQRFIKDVNNKKHIDEIIVDFDFKNGFLKILEMKYNGFGWTSMLKDNLSKLKK